MSGVPETDFTPDEQVELMTMDNNTRALARFLGSVLLRAAKQPEVGSKLLFDGQLLEEPSKTAKKPVKPRG